MDTTAVRTARVFGMIAAGRGWRRVGRGPFCVVTFLLSKLLWAILRPGSLLLLLAWAGLCLAWLSRRRLGHALIALGLSGYLAILILPIDQWLLAPLEERFQKPDPAPAHVDGIIVLGGVIDSAISADRGAPALSASAERITDAVILAKRYPDAKIVFTGGNGDLMPIAPTEADYAKTLLVALGVDSGRITLEGASRNTVENAVFTRDLVHPQPGQTWLLVTSASHMPRSVGIFRQVGWPVVAWPVGYKSGHSMEVQYTRQFGDKIAQLEWAVHEWVGLLAYRLLGRTDALFPAP